MNRCSYINVTSDFRDNSYDTREENTHLTAFELDKCRDAELRSKAIWAVESDKNTKYFLNLEKYKQENNSIKELLNDNNESVYATEGILDLQYKFYKELYSCVDTDNDKMSELIYTRSFKEFDLYSKATGAKINKQKSEILCVGYGELSDVETEQFGLQVCKDAIQLLGVYVGPNKSLCDDMNWKNKIRFQRQLIRYTREENTHLTDEWKNTIDNNVHHRNIDRTIDISVLIKNVPCDLKSCNVKKLYQCVLEDITEEPIGPIVWKKLYALDEAELCKI
ncbi:unnamed protein product [Mytilus coruscus]|uniref:Reverse transcriptase domain-containing protein n=1 Tax=Mytilus coruscus TaxID=42192 RepID=A0A6J8A529_MYTCO|nr:unnamed protein product [Mytilus coruscus]